MIRIIMAVNINNQSLLLSPASSTVTIYISIFIIVIMFMLLVIFTQRIIVLIPVIRTVCTSIVCTNHIASNMYR